MRAGHIRLVTITIILMVLAVGCGSSGQMPTQPPADINPVESSVPPPGELRDQAVDNETKRVVWGIYNLRFDPVTKTVLIEPERLADMHINVTQYVLPPECPDCIGITIVGYDPDTSVYSIKVTLKNPTPLTAYDVRGILLIGHDPNREIVNVDEYTEIFDDSDPSDRNPFKAFATTEPGRQFVPEAIHEVQYDIMFLPPQNFNVKYVIDASWPGNQKEPFRIYDQAFAGDLDDLGLTSVELVANVQDWQGDVESVKLDVTPLGGVGTLDLIHQAGDIWKLDVTNEWSAPEGDYLLWLEAKSVDNEQILYDLVPVTVVPYPNSPPVWLFGANGIASVAPGNTEVSVGYGVAVDPNLPVTYVVYYSTVTPIDFGTASTVETELGSPTIVPNLTNDIEYHFAVRARDALGLEETNTNELSTTPTYDNSPPVWEPPPGVTSVAPLSQAEEVTFGSAIDPDLPVTYNIYYSETTPIDFGTAPSVNVPASPGIVPGLDNAKTYYFAVRAMDGLGLEDNNTMEAEGSPNLPPEWDNTIGATGAIPGNGEVEVTYGNATDPDNPVTYVVYYSTISPIDFGTAENLEFTTGSPATIPDLTNGQEYHFAVRVRDSLGLEDENIIEVSATPSYNNDPPVWDTTVGVQGLTPLSQAMSVSFGNASDPDTPVTYNIYYSETSPIDFGSSPKVNVAASPGTVDSFDNAKIYHFAVRAMDSLGLEETNTVELSGSPNLPPGWDTTVGIQSVTPLSGEVEVTFGTATDVDTQVTFNVYYSLTTPIDFDTSPSVNVPSSPTTVGELSNAESYYFAVRAMDGLGLEDDNTIELETSPNTPPEWPGGVGIIDATGGFDFAILTFYDATDVDPPVTYNVYYSKTSPIDFGIASKIMGVEPSPFRVDDLDHDSIYYFAVRAQDAYGLEETNTNEASAYIWALPEVKWTHEFGGVVFSSPNYVDLSGDGTDDIVVGGWNSQVKALDGVDGTPIWTSYTSDWVESSPAIVQIDGGKMDVLVGCYDGRLYAISGADGSGLGDFQTGGIVSSSPAIADIDNDSKMEAVFGSLDGKVYAVEIGGSVEWSISTFNGVYSSPALYDRDGDDLLETFIGSRSGFFYCIGHDGDVKWTYPTIAPVNSSPAIGDVDNDGQAEAVVASFDGKVHAVNMDGTLQWEFDIGGYIMTSPALGDFNKDGGLDVALGADNTNFYLIDGITGTVLWSFPSGNRIWSSAAIADMSGDGILDVIVGSNDGFLWCIDGSDGTSLWSFETGEWVDSSPAVVDLDHDGFLEIVFGCSDGTVYCLDSNAPVPEASMHVWPKFRKSTDNRGVY